MSRRRISQNDARAAIAEVSRLRKTLMDQRNVWARQWPGGVHIGTVTYTEPALVCEAAITARKLGHAVVAIPQDDRKSVYLYALPLAEVTL